VVLQDHLEARPNARSPSGRAGRGLRSSHRRLTEIRTLIARYCDERLGAALCFVRFYRRGVEAVFGLTLTDDRQVVIKVHRPQLIGLASPTS
jgi:hypothetical protein